MASSGLDYSLLTPENNAVADMRELLFLQTIVSEKIEAFHTVDTKVINGEKIGIIGEFASVGAKKGAGCGPTFGTDTAPITEKIWAIGRYEIAEEICYDDLVATVAQKELKAPVTQEGDLTGTYVMQVYTDLLQPAMEKMVWRLAWFGDTAAALVAGGGKLKAGTTVALFTTCDGFWKRLITIITATPSQKVSISRNVETGIKTSTLTAGGTGYAVGDVLTVNGGTAKIKVLTLSTTAVATYAVLDAGIGYAVSVTAVATTSDNGVGTGCTITISAINDTTYATQMLAPTDAVAIIDAMIYKADIRLRNATDKFIMCTRSLSDAFEQAITSGAVYTEIQWTTNENGMSSFKRKGVDIYPIDAWDATIQAYEDNGTKFNAPHRAVFTTKSNLRVGVPTVSAIASLDIWFNKDLQKTRIYGKDQMGTQIVDDKLVMVAI